MKSRDESLTAIDVIRCVWLARMAAQQGDQQAAQRWRAKVDAWLERTQVAKYDVTVETATMPQGVLNSGT